MALIIPRSVGGDADIDVTQQPIVEPVEKRASNLIIPASVGGDAPAVEAVQPEPIPEPVATPLSEIVPEVAQGVAKAVETIQAPETGFVDFLTGSERIKATPELGTLPEFGSTKGSGRAFGILTTLDPKAQVQILKDSIPGATTETTPDGSIIVEVPIEGGGIRRSVLNRPGFSSQDVVDAVTQVIQFLPAAKLATLGKTLLKKFGIGAAGSAATEQALQETGVEFLGREQRDPTATAIAGVAGGVGELIVPAVQAVRSARNASKVGADAAEIGLVAESVGAAREAAKETGIPLFQAQQTVIPSQLEKQAFVASLPAGTQSAIVGIRAQNKSAGEAVDNFLGQIAPDSSVVTGAERFRTAANTAVEAKKRIRSEAASPIYKQAFRRQRQGKVGLIDTAQLQVKLREISKQFDPKGQIAKNMESALEKIKNAKGNLQKLHLAKTEIDQTIESFGADAVGNTTKRFLTDIKTDLVDELVKQSPSYRAARDEFIRLSPEVTAIRDSIVGKVANLDDVQLKQASGKIFDAAQTNPSVVANAKRVIDDVDPGAWNELLRVELERRLGAIKPAQEGETLQNIPGQLLRALFPNEKSTKVLMNALDAEGKKNLTFLKTALSRASLGRPGGSQTAAREEIKKELRGGVVQSIRNFISSPLKTVSGVGEDAAFNRRTRALAKSLFDPTWKAEMSKIRKLSPDSPAAARAMTQLLDNIGSTEESNNE